MQRGRLLARTLVRSTLARYTNGAVDPASLRFQKNQYGKPEVLWPALTTNGKSWKPPPLSFNLSHTTSLLACAVALDSAIGVDVEEKERLLKHNLMTFARKKLSLSEAEWLEDISDVSQQRRRFMQLWTLKEAYVKAVGKGISGVPFREFSFRLTNSPEAREFLTYALELPADSQAKLISLDLAKSVAEREKAASCWKFVQFEPSPAHIAALCVEDKLQDSDEAAVPFRVRAWKTIPFCSDHSLHNRAVGLGVSSGCQLHYI
ncbi:hypothetical protein R1flu_004427 [Riccia fluitans]|uniref:holo-[acyl-carrier-protein] synthase n=1 Tax=Riccia fluitans TaxID=41844 RepID=A0ABD1YQU8_9MARC